jgi:hypothetical protein
MSPVLGVAVGQLIRLGPDAQIRVVGHEGDRRRTQGLRMINAHNSGQATTADKKQFQSIEKNIFHDGLSGKRFNGTVKTWVNVHARKWR